MTNSAIFGIISASIAFCGLAVTILSYLSRIQSELSSKLGIKAHDEICEKRDAEVRETLGEIRAENKHAFNDIKRVLEKHIDSRALVDERAADSRHTTNNTLQRLLIDVAVIQTTLDVKK